FIRRPPPRSPLFPYTTLFRSPGGSAVSLGAASLGAVSLGAVSLGAASPGVAAFGSASEVEIKTTFRGQRVGIKGWTRVSGAPQRDRKSTRLNSSHVKISYAVF